MTTNVSYDVSDDVVIWLENEQEMLIYLPAVYFSLTLMIIGLIGNGLVVYAYGFRFKKTCANVYTYWLAIFDICCCTISIPFEVFHIRYPLLYDEPISCKFFRTFSLVLYLSEGLMLLCIALDRYMKICNPMRSSVRKSPRLHVLITVLLSLLLAWPTAFVFGQSSAETRYSGVVGSTCSIVDDLKESLFPGLYFAFLLTIAVAGFIALVFFYGKILRVVCRWKTNMIGELSSTDTNGRDSKISNCPQSTTPCFLVDKAVVLRSPMDEPRKILKKTSSVSVDLRDVLCTHWDIETPKRSRSSSLDDMEDRNPTQDAQTRIKTQAQISKTTFIFLVVSVTFVLSYMPYLTTEVLLKTNVLVLKEQSDVVQQVLAVVVKMYCINNASNPVIYSIFNRTFRKECSALFKKTKINTCNIELQRI